LEIEEKEKKGSKKDKNKQDRPITTNEAIHIAWDILLYNLDLATDLVYVATTQYYNDHFLRASIFFIAIPLIMQIIIEPVSNRVMKVKKSRWELFKDGVLLTFGGAPYVHRNIEESHLLHMNKTANAYYQDVPQFFIQLLNNMMIGTPWSLVQGASPIISAICTFNKLSRPLQGIKCKGSEFICYVFMVPITIVFMITFSKHEEGLTDKYGAEY
jgi:hypothetical protein